MDYSLSQMLSDDNWAMDFDSFIADFDCLDSSSSETQLAVMTQKTGNVVDGLPVCLRIGDDCANSSTVEKNVKKVAKTVHKAKKPVVKFTVSTVMSNGSLQFKGKTRRHPEAKLYAFPSFDKSDALVYFPTTMARLLNSSDFPALTKLVHSHLHKNCEIRLGTKQPVEPVNAAHFLAIFELMDQVHPDSIMCCHSTKVVENEIQARVYFKYTDCKALMLAIRRTVTDPRFEWLTKHTREDLLKKHFELEERPEHEQEEMEALLDSGEDLVVYGEVDLRLKYDDFTKKVTDFNYAVQFTSLASSSHSSVPSMRTSVQ